MVLGSAKEVVEEGLSKLLGGKKKGNGEFLALTSMRS